jgi:hypothetical protein
MDLPHAHRDIIKHIPAYQARQAGEDDQQSDGRSFYVMRQIIELAQEIPHQTGVAQRANNNIPK